MQAHPPSAGECAQVSRDAPPPPPPLPGGYRVGQKVFYTGASYTYEDGDKRVHGQQVEVTGPATSKERDTHLAVLFPGNTGNVECLLTEVRRLRAASAATPPPAPHTRDAAHAPSARPPAPCVCPGAPTPTASVAAHAVAQRPGSGRASDAPRAVGVRPAGEGSGRGKRTVREGGR